ncbi:cyclic nucleotide-binding domain-containing protein [Actinopolymorpha rutila]|uniref:CRP-like cAMP-binding protein n=1 Tax=Actinopolymorpha rutila TaxID=446787 RepID=A0A852ZMS4_9ACTN|nr:cyclic nucleotide-binding domain-containing protein [Actinopolymorpha rutila]NYH90440.1 CRP-like cAMP-binding protein [Actinopolymorpha rutila]
MGRRELEELAAHPFLAGLPRAFVAQLGEHARTVTLPGSARLFDEGAAADRFWLLWDGQVMLDLHVPGRGTLLVETLGHSDVLGWSWLFPPYRWRFGAAAAVPTPAVEIDAEPLRGLVREDAEFGRAMYQRFAEVAVDRLQATRLRLLNAYAMPGEG